MKLRKTSYNKCSRLVFCFLMVVFITGCSADEPPLNFGNVKPGQMARSTKLIGMDGETIMQKITYPALGLTSVATVGFRTGVMREEIFEGKWRVVFVYENAPEVYGIPSRIIIYQFRGGSYDKKINEYKHENTKLNQLFYRDINGKVVVRDPSYFQVGGSPMGSPLGGAPFGRTF